MEINASLVKELREKTGVGMMDCKKALVECGGDMDKAIDYLREKGLSKAAKKADRIAAEGLSNIYIKDNEAIIIEVNCETDFVSSNVDFKALVDKIGGAVLNSKANTIEEAKEVLVDGKSINDLVVEATLTIGEKIDFRRFVRVTKTSDESFGSYLHMGGKISALVTLSINDEVLAKDLAMQTCAMNPKYISKEEVPAEVLEHEKSVLKEQILNEGKKAEFMDKILEGKVEKFYEDVCLINQSYIKDGSLKISALLEKSNAKVLNMIRYEVGEGIEKRSDNFAEEVMNQLNK
jgi:elongation factor Ts